MSNAIEAVEPRRFDIGRHRVPALVVGLLGAVAYVAGVILVRDREIVFRSYLFAWFFFLGLSLGGMCLVMLHNLTGGDWGFSPRMIGQAAAYTLPFLAILFIPLLFGLPALYPWDRAAAAANDTLRHRQAYMNLPFFLGRAAGYFVLWIFLSWIISHQLRRWKATGDARHLTRLRGWSAAGLILYLVSMTHAGIDWIISRDISFYSTTFGFILTTGQTLAALAFAIILASLLPRNFPAAAPRSAPGILNDVGNVLLTLVILWTYVSFMQLLVIWMGDKQEDAIWYVQRGLSQPGPWRWIGLGLVLFHFFIPFYLLLFRAAKRHVRALAAIAWMLFLAHIVADYWLIAPSGHDGPVFNLHWLDFAAFFAIGGLWLALFLMIFGRVAFTDPTVLPGIMPEGVPAHD